MAAGLTLASPAFARSYVEALREGFRRGDQSAKKPGEIDRIERNFETFVADLTRKTGDVVLPDGQVIPRVARGRLLAGGRHDLHRRDRPSARSASATG